MPVPGTLVRPPLLLRVILRNLTLHWRKGAYHSGTPGGAVDDSMLSGCALGIADVDEIGKVTMDNLAIFSVQQQCVKSRMTEFEVRGWVRNGGVALILVARADPQDDAALYRVKVYLWLVSSPFFLSSCLGSERGLTRCRCPQVLARCERVRLPLRSCHEILHHSLTGIAIPGLQTFT